MEEHYMRILFDIKNRDSIVYSKLLLALEKFNNSEHNYIVSKRSSERLCRTLGVNRRGRVKLEKHDRELPRLYFIFLHWQWLCNISFFNLFNSDNTLYFLLTA